MFTCNFLPVFLKARGEANDILSEAVADKWSMQK